MESEKSLTSAAAGVSESIYGSETDCSGAASGAPSGRGSSMRDLPIPFGVPEAGLPSWCSKFIVSPKLEVLPRQTFQMGEDEKVRDDESPISTAATMSSTETRVSPTASFGSSALVGNSVSQVNEVSPASDSVVAHATISGAPTTIIQDTDAVKNDQSMDVVKSGAAVGVAAAEVPSSDHSFKGQLFHAVADSSGKMSRREQKKSKGVCYEAAYSPEGCPKGESCSFDHDVMHVAEFVAVHPPRRPTSQTAPAAVSLEETAGQAQSNPSSTALRNDSDLETARHLLTTLATAEALVQRLELLSEKVLGGVERLERLSEALQARMDSNVVEVAKSHAGISSSEVTTSSVQSSSTAPLSPPRYPTVSVENSPSSIVQSASPTARGQETSEVRVEHSQHLATTAMAVLPSSNANVESSGLSVTSGHEGQVSSIERLQHKSVTAFPAEMGLETARHPIEAVYWLSSTCNVTPFVASRWLQSWISTDEGLNFFTFRYSRDAWDFLKSSLREQFKEHLAGTQASDLSIR